LALHNTTGFGDTAFGRKKRIVALFPSHGRFSPNRCVVSLI
jgi:hypothetical protein